MIGFILEQSSMSISFLFCLFSVLVLSYRFDRWAFTFNKSATRCVSELHRKFRLNLVERPLYLVRVVRSVRVD